MLIVLNSNISGRTLNHLWHCHIGHIDYNCYYPFKVIFLTSTVIYAKNWLTKSMHTTSLGILDRSLVHNSVQQIHHSSFCMYVSCITWTLPFSLISHVFMFDVQQEDQNISSISSINRPHTSVILVSLIFIFKNTYFVVTYKLFYVFYNLFQALTHVSEACYPLLDGCRKNRQKWQSLAEQQEKNLINGESNQAKRNWDANLKTTSLSPHRRRSNRGVLHSTKHCMDLDYVFATAVLFFHISIYSMTVYMPRSYISFITSKWDGKRSAELAYTNLFHKKVWVQFTRLSLRAYYFIDVYSCSVIILWPVS